MVAVVNSVVIGASAGLLLEVAGVRQLAIPVAVGAIIGAGAFALHERHHRRARDAYSAETVDQAAIFMPPSQPDTSRVYAASAGGSASRISASSGAAMSFAGVSSPATGGTGFSDPAPAASILRS
jgi:hypothetical protein